jgi:hypothetical protein
MDALYMTLDPYMIWFYRITGYGFVDFLVGTFVIAFVAVVVGEFTISLLFVINQRHIDEINGKVRKYQDLSHRALMAKDKAAYKAANTLANDAFGKSFFMQIGLSAGSLWPLFLAMGWINHRFPDVEFDLLFTGYSMGCVGVLIVMYASAHLVFKRVKYRLPYFRKIKAMLDTYGSPCAGEVASDDMLRLRHGHAG